MQFEDLQVGDKIVVVGRVRDIYKHSRSFSVRPARSDNATDFSESDVVTWPDRKRQLEEKAEELRKQLAETRAAIDLIGADGLSDEVGKIGAAMESQEYVPEVHDEVYDNEWACGATVNSIDSAGGCVLNYHDGGSQPAIKTRGFAKHELFRLRLVSRGEPVKGDTCEYRGEHYVFMDFKDNKYRLRGLIGGVTLDKRSDFRIITSAEVKA